MRPTIMRCTSFSTFSFSSNSTGTYHRDTRVFPCLFCSKKNRIIVLLGRLFGAELIRACLNRPRVQSGWLNTNGSWINETVFTHAHARARTRPDTNKAHAHEAHAEKPQNTHTPKTRGRRKGQQEKHRLCSEVQCGYPASRSPVHSRPTTCTQAHEAHTKQARIQRKSTDSHTQRETDTGRRTDGQTDRMRSRTYTRRGLAQTQRHRHNTNAQLTFTPSFTRSLTRRACVSFLVCLLLWAWGVLCVVWVLCCALSVTLYSIYQPRFDGR